MRREVAVVTIVHGRHGHLARQLRSLSAGAPQASHVVVAMADPELLSVDLGERVRVVAIDADPGSLPLAAARNRGAEEALERGADTIVFLDVDCIPGPSLVSAYDSAVARWPGASGRAP